MTTYTQLKPVVAILDELLELATDDLLLDEEIAMLLELLLLEETATLELDDVVPPTIP